MRLYQGAWAGKCNTMVRSVVALDVEDVSEDDAGLRLVLRRSKTTKPQTDLYARLDLPLPKKVIEITPAWR